MGRTILRNFDGLRAAQDPEAGQTSVARPARSYTNRQADEKYTGVKMHILLNSRVFKLTSRTSSKEKLLMSLPPCFFWLIKLAKSLPS